MVRMAAIALIVAGALGLAYGGFTYTKDTQNTQLGPFELTIADRERVNIPVWAGVATIVVGGLLLFIPRSG
jgi:hypothetical protein